MEKRVRSPNYPAMSLPEAINRASLVYKNQHTHGAPREVVAKSMGYNSLNGASATAISALTKYGLLEGRGEEIRISDRTMQILHPQSPEEKAAALRAAAGEPDLFRELAEKFPGKMPAEEVLRNYLIRDGFAPNAVSSVILSYRETNEFVEREAGAYDSGVAPLQEAPSMQHQPATSNSMDGLKPLKNHHIMDGTQRLIAVYTFEGGRAVEIRAIGDVPTEEALETAETLIEMKRKEIARNAKRASADNQPEDDEV